MGSEEEKTPEPPPSSGGTAAGGGVSRRAKGNRGGYRQKSSVTKTAFEGKCDELKGHIYDCTNSSKAADMYTKTTREIAEYIGRTIKHSVDIVKGIESLKEPILTEPEDLPDDASPLEKRKWEKTSRQVDRTGR
jgi:hypothetical protein